MSSSYKDPNANTLVRDLTLALLYLTGWTEDGMPEAYKRAWKGYDFSVLEELEKKDYIRQGSHPSRTKSLTLTPEGAQRAKEILESIGAPVNDDHTIDFDPGQIDPSRQALRLHLELLTELDQRDMDTLRTYGRMEKSISRDIVVPATMDFHGLHYAIQKLFGWNNCHLHHFELEHKDFSRLTNDRVKDMLPLLGIWFRFPTDDFADVYWDDNYREGQDFNAWLRKKYRGPYHYGGQSETWENCQREVAVLKAHISELRIPGFLSDTKQDKTVPLEKATPEELMKGIYFEGGSFYELIERNLLRDILLPPTAHAESVSTIRQRSTHSRTPIPFVNSLLYQYDYGDGWEVRISCEDWYYMTAADQICNARGRLLAGDELESLLFCIQREAPRCLAADGMCLLDDVGGPHGFCEMLRAINQFEDMEENQSMREWASGMGWSSRRKIVKRML